MDFKGLFKGLHRGGSLKRLLRGCKRRGSVKGSLTASTRDLYWGFLKGLISLGFRGSFN